MKKKITPSKTIKCPECGRVVLEKTKNCPSCGFGIEEEFAKLKKPNIFNKDTLYGLFFISMGLIMLYMEARIIPYLEMILGLMVLFVGISRYKKEVQTYEFSKGDRVVYFDAVNFLEVQEELEHLAFQDIMRRAKQKQQNPYGVRCPYCCSTDVAKISTISKAMGVAILGKYALAKATKQWHCYTCKSDF